VAIESRFKKVLDENDYGVEKTNMNDFVKLMLPMRLNEYSVRFPRFPWLENVAPFEHWTKDDPTKTIDWFQRYHKAKHDAFNNRLQPTLRHAVSAVAGLYCVVRAMFGLHMQTSFSHRINEIIVVNDTPTWSEKEACIALLDPYSPHRFERQTFNFK
jgi:hypothetical protein